ncbi:MAG: helix-turn-helix domain-containing protein [Rickettsiales bacterium]|nr:helix-turn-helix domain-containing protein [Rickettsiales bacterium]
MKVWSWRQAILRASLESTTKLVLLVLSTYMNDHGEGCYPSTTQIAHDASLTERAVFTHLRKAEMAGFLVRDKRELSGRKWASNEYRAAYPGNDEPYSVENAGVNLIHPTPSPELDSPHGSVRDEPDSVEGCTTFMRGMNDVHTNSPKNSPLNSSIELSPKQKKSYPPEFEQFWSAWPAARRCEKPNAFTAWRDACKKIPSGVLMAALQRYVLTNEATDGFAPYPAKWLKRGRWLEFMPETSPAQATSTLDKRDDDTPETAEWLAILQHLRSKHGEAVCRSWFGQLRQMNKQGGQMTLQAPTRFVAEWVKTHYAADILQAVQSVWPGIIAVRIDGSPAPQTNRQSPTENTTPATPAWSDSGQQ